MLADCNHLVTCTSLTAKGHERVQRALESAGGDGLLVFLAVFAVVCLASLGLLDAVVGLHSSTCLLKRVALLNCLEGLDHTPEILARDVGKGGERIGDHGSLRRGGVHDDGGCDCLGVVERNNKGIVCAVAVRRGMLKEIRGVLCGCYRKREAGLDP